MQQANSRAGLQVVDASTYQCKRVISLKSVCSRRLLANIWTAHKLLLLHNASDLELSPLIVHAEFSIKTLLSL